MDKKTLTESIKSKANNLGFQLVGVTTPHPPPHFAVYERWLTSGRHGGMEYMGTDRNRLRRSDPRQILPECKSILTLGVRYPAPEASKTSTPERPLGRVASYAWAEDYHAVLKPRLKSLVKYIEEQVGNPIPNRWYTDTGPILERDLAERAGLGWIGKNTCLIHPKMGSYFFLAEILLGIPLAVDEPFKFEHCGTCTRCIEACPTDCILPDRTIDARLCISYLTIELKGPIPLELRGKIGNWIFGCDVCQEVCPWNLRFANSEGDPAFRAKADLPQPDLREELQLTPQRFNQKFRSSPVKRAKRRGYLRNVTVALGNSGYSKAIPDLIRVLRKDKDALVRRHAAWAMAQIGDQSTLNELQRAAEIEKDPEVLEEIKTAFRQLSRSHKTDRSHTAK